MLEEQKPKIEVPASPNIPGFPDSLKREWRAAYMRGFRQAEIDSPADEMAQRAAAAREANRVFRVEEPSSYKDAMALEGWKVLRRDEKDGVLRVVTIDGKKFSFPVPAKAAETKK